MVGNNEQAKILIVDDQPANLDYLSNLLIPFGYLVETAIGGQLALERAIASPPDLILLDIMMPQIDGYEVCRQLKSIDITKDIPVIFISFLEKVSEKIKAFQMGGSDYITKPFHLEEILVRIENNLNIQKLQKQLKAQNAQLQKDIAKRKLAEEALRQSEERFRNLVETLKKSETNLAAAQRIAHVANWEYNLKTGEINWSEEVFRIFGLDLTQGEPTYQQLIEMIHADDRAIFKKSVESAIAAGTPYELDLQILRTDGCIRHLEARGEAIFNPSKQVKQLFGTILDITERKQLEQLLFQSQQFLNSIIEHIPLALFVKDVNNDFRFVLWNKTCKEMFGSTKQEVIGRNAHDLYPKEQADFFLQKDLETVSQNQSIEIEEEPIDSYSRGTILLRTVKVPISNKGKVTHLLGISEDITERQRRENALRLIVEGTASTTGDTFMRSCVRYLAEVLQVRYAILTEWSDKASTSVRTLAFWMDETWCENFEYDIIGTPCEIVLNGAICYYPENVQKLFPQDRDLVRLEAQSYLGIPLINLNGEVIGHLAVLDIKPMEPDLGREAILKIFAARAAAELERKRMEEALQRRAARDRSIGAISKQFINPNIDAAINFALEEVGKFAKSDRCRIFRYTDDRTKFYNTKEWCAPGIESFIDRLQSISVEAFAWIQTQLQNGQVVQIDRVADLPPAAAVEKAMFEKLSIQSLLAVPMFYDQRLVGIVGLETVRLQREWKADDISLLQIVGELIALASARHQAENESRLLLETTRAIGRAEDLDSALEEILQLICRNINWNVGEAWIPSEDGTLLTYSSGWYGGNTTLEKFRHHSQKVTFTLGAGLPGRIWESQQPEWLEDVSDSQQSIFLRTKIAAKVGLKAGFGIPILANNRLLAVLVFFKQVKSTEDRRLVELIKAVAAQLGSLIQQKQAEAAMQRQLTAIEAATDGIAVLNQNLEYIYLNKAHVTMFDYGNASELIGKTWKELYELEEINRFERDIFPILLQKKHWQGEASGKKRNGIAFAEEISLTLTAKGELLCVCRDISERKGAELALQESVEREKAIATIVQRMRQTLDLEMIFRATTQDLRQVINCDRVAVYRFNSDWSGAFVAESVGGQWISLIQQQNYDSSFKEGTLESGRCAVKTLSSTDDLVVDTYLQETQGGAYTKGTSYLCVKDIYQAGFAACYIGLLEKFEVRAYITVPIFCGDKLWGLLATYQNSGSRQWKTAEINIVVQVGNQLGVALQQAELLAQTQRQSAALQQAVVAADAANRAKSEFLANMSHELRTPLNAILGFTQVMSRDNSLSPDHQQNLTIINRAGEHLLDLINDILEMSKIEAGRTTLNRSSFDLIRLLDGLEKMLQLRAASKGLQLVFDLASDLPQYVQTDESKLRQVLLNLLGNAIKFTQKGGVTLRVGHRKWGIERRQEEISNAQFPMPQACLWFEVEDTGSGIAPEEIDLLFEAFRQTETGRKSQQGTGLGLAISRRYVQLMGGDIGVSSTVGSGSLFVFNIGVSAANAADIQTPQTQRKIIGLAAERTKYRILAVDDRPESRLLLVKLLSSIGFSVCEAENGQQAITLWESWQPHLILMDMRMPVMDGYEATRQIKAREHDKFQFDLSDRKSEIKTIIIALTASAFEEQRQAILSIGCDDFIGKPFQEEILLEKIGQHLGLCYLYEESLLVEAEISEPKTSTQADLMLLLAQMSAQWMTQLYHAAAQCSDELILELLEQIPLENKPLAEFLTDLANNFQFEKIMNLAQRGENGSRSG